MNFNFKPVDRGNFNNPMWDHDALRVSSKSIVVGSAPTERLGSRRIQVEVDAHNKAIRLTPSPRGHLFRAISGGRLRQAGKNLLDSIPNGDYAYVGNNTYVAN